MKKKSKYNIEINENTIYNSLYGTLVEFDNETTIVYRKVIMQEKLNEEEMVIKKQLVSQGMLIDEIENEIEILKNRFSRGKYSNDKVEITIIPSFSCNFSCVYCYQEMDTELMDIKMQDNVIEFIKKVTKSSRELNVTWFGGEPLMHFDIVERLSYEIQHYCMENKIIYTAGIVTNGFLLTDSILMKINKLSINNVQITIDGPKNTHNQRRMLIRGGETFDQCIEAIKKITNQGIYVNIRINIDKTNYEKVDELLVYLSTLKMKNFSIDIQKVTEFTEKCNCFAEKCFERGEYLTNSAILYNKIAELGLYNEPNIFLPEAMFGFCIAHSVMSYIISPNGDLYKCLDCDLLPLCMGGCPRDAAEGKRECFVNKENLLQMIKIFLKEVC